MDKLSALIDSNVIYALGWTLLHSLWQCLVVYVVLRISLKISQNYAPAVRYLQCLAALCLCVMITIFTFVENYQNINHASAFLSANPSTLVFSEGGSWWTAVFKLINPWLDGIVLIWALGVLLHLSVYLKAFVHLQGLRRHATEIVSKEWQQKLSRLTQRIAVKRQVTFKLSKDVLVPCVIGHVKPLVLLPVAIFTQVPCEQIEAIVLHELAHIKRADFLINVLQCLAKAVFFFNPSMVFINRLVDEEREKACDDLAVSACGDPLLFAHSLSRFAQVTPHSQLVMAANKDRYFILSRVKRLFDKRSGLSGSTERLVAVISILLMALTVNVSAAKEPQLPAQAKFAEEQGLIKQNRPPADVVFETSHAEQSEQPIDKQDEVQIPQVLAVNDMGDNAEQKNTSQLSDKISGNQTKVGSTGEQAAPDEFILAAITQSDRSMTLDDEPEASDVVNQLSASTDYLISKSQEAEPDKPLQKSPSSSTNSAYHAANTVFNRFIMSNVHVLDKYQDIAFLPLDWQQLQIESNLVNFVEKTNIYLPELQGSIVETLVIDGGLPVATESRPTLNAQLRLKNLEHRNYRVYCLPKGRADMKQFCVYSNRIILYFDVVLSDSITGNKLALADNIVSFDSEKDLNLGAINMYWGASVQETYWDLVIAKIKQDLKTTIAQIQISSL
jgi:beta-lactamase regulating signal transducer with metallopeptidase domain